MAAEIFISYSRKDNLPAAGDDIGWVTALREEILADHRNFSTEPLEIFFDTEDIKLFEDWRLKIRSHLRESKILLVCLSPNYYASPVCQWEWEEYERMRAHNLVGYEGLAPVYFVESPYSDELLDAAWIEAVSRGAEPTTGRYEWEKRWRLWHRTVDGVNRLDLQPWYPNGVNALREVAVRERIQALGSSLWDRLRRARRAQKATESVPEMNPHFLGRTSELADLHNKLSADSVGVVTALNGLGGQGKTELALAYAHIYGDRYAGGVHLLRTEGKAEMTPLLADLAGDLGVAVANESAETLAAHALGELKRRATVEGDDAAALLILDNVTETSLLSEPQLRNLPRVPWLRIVATTRESPREFTGVTHRQLAFIPVDALSRENAARLIESHQIETDGHWPAATAMADHAAALELAADLDGFTLAVEAVGIYLGLHPEIRPSDYRRRLLAEGLTSVDDLSGEPGVSQAMRNRAKQLRIVLAETFTKLSPAERTALEFACLLPPDSIPWPWLRDLVVAEHPDVGQTRPGYPEPWSGIRRRLEGLRLLAPGDDERIGRMHRMVSAEIQHDLDPAVSVARLAAIDDFIDDLQARIEHESRLGGAVLWQLKALQNAILRLDSDDDCELRHARRAGVVGMIELQVGRLDQAYLFLDTYRRISEAATLADPLDAEAARQHSISLNLLGDFLVRRGSPGDQDQAFEAYQRGLDVRERLLKDNPSSAEAARDVSVSLNKVGDFLVRRGASGDQDKAFEAYQRSLDVAERLLKDNPSSAEAARDVSVSLNKVGDFLVRRGSPGDQDKAFEAYQRSLDVAERLLKDNPSSAEAARDVSVSLDRLGDFLARRGSPGDQDKAFEAYQRSLDVRERLLKDNPSSAEAARDVSVSLSKVGDFLARRGSPGDQDKAIEAYQKSLDVAERLLKDNPSSAVAARDVSVSLDRLGDFLARRGSPGDQDKAFEAYQRSLDVRERLLKDNPSSAVAARDVSVSLERLGDFLARRGSPGDQDKAFVAYQRSLDVRERLLKDNPASAEVVRDVVVSHYKLAQFGEQTGDTTRAARHWEACYQILHERITQGAEFDSATLKLYEKLASGR